MSVRKPILRRKTLRKNRQLRFLMQSEAAIEAIGDIWPGMELFGLTKGQFSFISVLDHLLLQTGPADVVISTWTAAGAEIETAKEFLENERIKSLRFLVDQSFPTRQPEYCKALLKSFGEGGVRMSRSHCKFATLTNKRWNLVVRTSMNLNENPRIENFEISDDKVFARFFSILSMRYSTSHSRIQKRIFIPSARPAWTHLKRSALGRE